MVRIAVLTGGLSDERDVALASGAAVAAALRERGHEVAVVDAADVSDGDAAPFVGAEASADAPEVAPEPPDDDAMRALRMAAHGHVLGPAATRTLAEADVVFNALHGGHGEDGHVQAALDMLGVPYTGAGFRACALAFHKPTAKGVLRQAGIPTADWTTLGPHDAPVEPSAYPVVVKPATGGSTVGVSICREPGELGDAVDLARRHGGDVVVESYVPGREFTVGILDGEPLAVVEIRAPAGFFDYRSKYQPGGAEEIAPAPIDPVQAARMQSLARAVHHRLGLGDAYSRVDLRDEANPRVLELNPLPGMTPMSLLPKSAGATGIDYAELCERIVAAALRAGRRSVTA